MKIETKYALLAALMLLTTPAWAVEVCGLWSEKGSEGSNPPRFRLLKGDQAFLDMKTCLVWSLNVHRGPLKLSDAFGHCARSGSRLEGGGDHMGWRLPSVAELTSLDMFSGEFALRISGIPSETPLWTATAWPPGMKDWTVVIFSQRGTTIVHHSDPEQEGGAWCVRCCPGAGLR
jgi:hypothetical protein